MEAIDAGANTRISYGCVKAFHAEASDVLRLAKRNSKRF
jgi:hypothetical protein